jgi:hypothetical protein
VPGAPPFPEGVPPMLVAAVLVALVVVLPLLERFGRERGYTR